MKMRKTYKITALILICLLSSNGCAAIVVGTGTSGDLGSVSHSFPLGEHREDAEDALGSPDKKCTRTPNDEQIIYYYFDEGQPPEAPVFLFDPRYWIVEAVTLGIFGLVVGSTMLYWDGPNGLMTVVYDKNDIVVRYRKHSYHELQSLCYGPMGCPPGILDCVDFRGGYPSLKMRTKAHCESRCSDNYHDCISSDKDIQCEDSKQTCFQMCEKGGKVIKFGGKWCQYFDTREYVLCEDLQSEEEKKERLKEKESESVTIEETCDPGMESCI